MTRPVKPKREPVEIKLVSAGVSLMTRVDPSTGKHSVRCDLCNEDILLTVTGHPQAFLNHRGSASCSDTGDSHASNPHPSRVRASRGRSSSRSREAAHPIPTIQLPRVRRCPGVGIKWTAGSIWSTYAYHLHVGDEIPWRPASFDVDENIIFLRDIHCSKQLSEEDDGPCHNCCLLPHSAAFKSFEERAHTIVNSTPWKYYTRDQLVQHLSQINKKSIAVRSELQAVERRVASRTVHIEEYKRIMMLLSTNEVAGLRRLLTASLRRGCSPRHIISLIQKAIQGLYTPHVGFTRRELDISFVVKSLGGPKLLYALNHSHGLPSESTVRRTHKIPQLLPSVAVPTKEEIHHNISAFFSPDLKPFPPAYNGLIPGLVGAFDGLAINSKCRYCPKRRAILGLCREHAHRVNTTVTNIESIEKVRDALFGEASKDPETKVCFGSDATVVAVGPYTRTDHYAMVPVIVSPSDKTEKAEDLAKWIQTFIDAWREHEYGERVSGPLWALASDGDSTFRRAKHMLCNVQRLDPDSPLGRRLSPLKGLNLYTSKEGITGTCDPKHIFKRFATLLRNTSGIIVYGRNITPHHTVDELSLLPDLSREAARELLDPADKQNVPKAVGLIQRLAALKTLPKPKDAFASERRDALIFMATFFMTFLQPFIDVNMSLSQQVVSLSTFAHLAAALWIEHGAACITGALYADCQAVIKNIMFVIARCQNISSELPLHIIAEGSDREERLFGNTRTQDHDRSVDTRRLGEKLSIAAILESAFEQNPDLDRGHRRLSLDGAIGIDHVNPASWKGDVRVGLVKLKRDWDNGRVAAQNLIRPFFGESRVPDFSKILETPHHDFLRPNGTYVGVKVEDSDRRSEEESVTTDANSGGTSDPLAPNIPNNQPIRSAGNMPFNTTSNPEMGSSDATDQEADSDSDSDSSLGDSADISNLEGAEYLPNHDSDEDFDVLDDLDDVAFDDFLPESAEDLERLVSERPEPEITPSLQAPISPKPTQVAEKLCHTFIVDGKEVPIDPIVSQLSPKHWRRVAMRTLRAQGRVIEDFSRSKFNGTGFFDGEELHDKDLMKATDLVALLVRSGQDICLAIMEVTSFSVKVGQSKSLRTTAKYADLSNKASQIKVIGQLISLTQSLDQIDASGKPEYWEWHRERIKLNIDSDTDLITRSQYVIEVPSVFVHAIAPEIAVSQLSPLQSGNRLVWSVSSAALQDHLEFAWRAMKPQSDEVLANLHLLPSINNPHALPYQDTAGNRHFYVKDLPSNFVLSEKLKGEDRVHCFICATEVKHSLMRNHVGRHIIWDLRGKKPPSGQEYRNPVGAFPCGFCGLDGCFTQIIETKKGSKTTRTVRSNCVYHYEGMNYKAACKSSTNMPCTNVPIPCALCPRSLSGDPQTIWKYSATLHLITVHPKVRPAGPDDLFEIHDMPDDVPPAMAVDMFISREEEETLGIEEEATTAYRDDNYLLASDDIAVIEQDLHIPEADRVKRGRAPTLSVVDPVSKKARKRT